MFEPALGIAGLNWSAPPNHPPKHFDFLGEFGVDAFGLVDLVVADQDEAAVELALNAFDQPLSPYLDDVDAEIAERRIRCIDEQQVPRCGMFGSIDSPIAVSSMTSPGSRPNTVRIQSWRKPMNSVAPSVSTCPDPAAAAVGTVGRIRKREGVSTLGRAAIIGPGAESGEIRFPVPPLAQARQGSLQPRPARATRRSRLGSASPLSHLRNADADTPVALASRSALGHSAATSCRRATNPACPAPDSGMAGRRLIGITLSPTTECGSARLDSLRFPSSSLSLSPSISSPTCDSYAQKHQLDATLQRPLSFVPALPPADKMRCEKFPRSTLKKAKTLASQHNAKPYCVEHHRDRKIDVLQVLRPLGVLAAGFRRHFQ